MKNIRLPVLLVVILLLALSGLFFVYKNRSAERIRINSDVEGFEYELSDRNEFESYLEEMGFFDDKEGKLVIKLVDSVPDSAFSQVDSEGNMIVESSVSEAEGLTTVNVGIGEFLRQKTPEETAPWIEGKFWDIIDSILKRKFPGRTATTDRHSFLEPEE